MKKIAIIIVLILKFIPGFSQDILLLKNGIKKQVKIIRIKGDLIYYMGFRDKKERIKFIEITKIKVIYFKNENRLQRISNSKLSKTDSTKVIVNRTTQQVKINNHLIVETDSTKEKKSVIYYKQNKPVGIGIDIFLQDKNEGLSGISLDYYLNRYFNIAVGYGYFYGRGRTYFSGKIIQKKGKRNWSPILDLSFTSFNYEIASKMNIKNIKISDSYLFFIPSVGIEYLDKKGTSFDLKLGISLLKTRNHTQLNSLTLSMRVGWHR